MVLNKKILWGICGVGSGHAYRQLPLIEHFAENNQIAVMTYGKCFEIYSKHFKNTKVKVYLLEIPYWTDGKHGMGFKETADLEKNKNRDFITANCTAMEEVADFLGKPDLVIGDYEPMCAQYAYAFNAPVITIDQQSKYLVGDFPKLEEMDYSGEAMRLQMFYPKAEARLACSFFNFKKKDSSFDVTIIAPVLRDIVTSTPRMPSKTRTEILVYLSGYTDYTKIIDTLEKTADDMPNVVFSVFASGITETMVAKDGKVHFFEPGDPTYADNLRTCNGLICTGGHTIISEAMYLGIPVYSIPRMQYEAILCSKIIEDNKFGTMSFKLDLQSIKDFIKNLEEYSDNIKNDTQILVRKNGKSALIEYVETFLEKQ